MKPEKLARGLSEGLKSSLKGKRSALTGTSAILFFTAVTLLSFPAYSSQLLSSSVFFIDEVLAALIWNMVKSSGYLGLALTAAYSALTGVAVTNTVTSIRSMGFNSTKDAMGALPGIAAAGCASCGVGFLGLIGLGGAVALFPFGGNLLRLAAVVLVAGVIANRGNPEKCAISES
ncbi:MAG: hypothetical protein ABEJ03_04085 [Candidatus Nanohaloarchaea archaeon]